MTNNLHYYYFFKADKFIKKQKKKKKKKARKAVGPSTISDYQSTNSVAEGRDGYKPIPITTATQKKKKKKANWARECASL